MALPVIASASRFDLEFLFLHALAVKVSKGRAGAGPTKEELTPSLVPLHALHTLLSWMGEEQDWNMLWVLWGLKICVVCFLATFLGGFLRYIGHMRTALTAISVTQIKIFIVKHFWWTYKACEASGDISLVFTSVVFSCNKIIFIFYHLRILWYVFDLMSCVSYFTDAHSTHTYSHTNTHTWAPILF